MTEGVIGKQLLLFSHLLLIGDLFQNLYSTIDSIVVGTRALTTVDASTYIINLLVGFFMWITTGAEILIVQFFGINDIKHLKEAIHTSLILSIISRLFLTVIWITFSPQILRLIETPSNVFNDSVLYDLFYWNIFTYP